MSEQGQEMDSACWSLPQQEQELLDKTLSGAERMFKVALKQQAAVSQPNASAADAQSQLRGTLLAAFIAAAWRKLGAAEDEAAAMTHAILESSMHDSEDHGPIGRQGNDIQDNASDRPAEAGGTQPEGANDEDEADNVEDEDEDEDDGAEDDDGDDDDFILKNASMAFSDIEAKLREAYTEVVRHRVINTTLDQAKTLLAAGTGITSQQLSEAISALRTCVTADIHKDSIDAVHARLLLAQQLFGHASSEEDLKDAEAHFKDVLDIGTSLLKSMKKPHGDDDCDEEGEDDEDDDVETQQATRESAQKCVATARTALGLLLAQRCRDGEAAEVIAAGNFAYRLSRQVIAYDIPANDNSASGSDQPQGTQSTTPDESKQYVRAIEKALPEPLLKAMQNALAPGSQFWQQHGYMPDGSTPYFSYVHSLPAVAGDEAVEDGCKKRSVQDASDNVNNESLMDQVIHVMRQRACELFPEAAGACHAEWWAHCRPHTHGHQLHFDSDNEGVGQVRNPIVSMVLYLTEGVGGPTLVTTQAFGDTGVPEHGWMVHPKLNRLTVFKGNMLHCVVPGRGVCPHEQTAANNIEEGHDTSMDCKPRFRVTFMVALWPDIRVRSYSKGVHGAAMPYPYSSQSNDGSKEDIITLPAAKKQKKGNGGKKVHQAKAAALPSWATDFQALSDTQVAGNLKGGSQEQQVQAACVSPIWSDVGAADDEGGVPSIATLTQQKKLPAYDLCFQGF